MGCSIISDTINVLVNGNGEMNAADAAAKLFGSALQNPDMSRVQLDTLLRRGQSDGASLRIGRRFWDTFLTQQKFSHANSNNLQS